MRTERGKLRCGVAARGEMEGGAGRTAADGVTRDTSRRPTERLLDPAMPNARKLVPPVHVLFARRKLLV